MAARLVERPLQAQFVGAQTVATDLQIPWRLAFLPDGRFLEMELPGRLRLVGAAGKLPRLLPVQSQ